MDTGKSALEDRLTAAILGLIACFPLPCRNSIGNPTRRSPSTTRGNFYICVLDYKSTASNDSSYISFLKSTDKGASWTGPFTVEDTIGPYFEDKQFIDIDKTGGSYNGNVYVAWARFSADPTRIIFSRSTDGALTFGDTTVIGPPISYNYSCGSGIIDAGQFAFPFVGKNGSVYVSWVGQSIIDTFICEASHCLNLVKSSDGGLTWSSPQMLTLTAGNFWWIDGNIDVYNAPICAADISNGPFAYRLYMAYADADLYNPPDYDFNIKFIRSLNSGTSWSSPIFINDDFTGPGALYDQFHPWLICNEDGILICIFYDQRTDPVNHYLFDVFAAYSFDGGESFTTNHRISDVSINPDNLKKEGKRFPFNGKPYFPAGQVSEPKAGRIAEYIGVTASHDHINADLDRYSQRQSRCFRSQLDPPNARTSFDLSNRG